MAAALSAVSACADERHSQEPEMTDKAKPYGPNDLERESDVLTIDGIKIEHSTPEQLEEERRRNDEEPSE